MALISIEPSPITQGELGSLKKVELGLASSAAHQGLGSSGADGMAEVGNFLGRNLPHVRHADAGRGVRLVGGLSQRQNFLSGQKVGHRFKAVRGSPLSETL